MSVARVRAISPGIRRTEILRAAIREIGKAGIAAVTMDDCARSAGVAKGTLYLYFKDKEDLIAAAIRSGLDELKQDLEQIAQAPGSVGERLRAMLSCQLRFFDSNRQLYRAFLEEKGRVCGDPKDPILRRLKKRHRSYVDFIIRIVNEGITTAEFRNLPGEKLGFVWVEMVGAMVVHRLTTPNQTPLEEDADFLVDLFLNGAAK